MKNLLLILVGVVALVILVVLFRGGAAPVEDEQGLSLGMPAYDAGLGGVPVEDNVVVSNKEAVLTLAEQNKSGEFGTVMFTDMGEKTRVVLKLSGAPSGVSQPAHIHMGSCADLGGIKYPLSYPVEGNSETLLDVSFFELQDQLPLAVMVHKNMEALGVYMACGDLY